ncbi:MAG: hypothetical protein MUO37_01435 [Methyloceanibacter sp.]|jgi:hypothetical protein|nr:hypothetical protein [Methyloceanibacter sp.]
MKRALLALLIVAGTLPALAADEAQAPRGMTVLTVSGLIGKTNRGPFDPKRDSVLALQKADFKNAFAFDRETLLSLPQGTVTVTTNEFDKPATFSGPLLREVLGYLEAAQVRTTFVALNGYTGWLDPDDIKASDWILALEVDGKPLGVGQQGPLWMLNTRSPDFKPNDEHHGHWVYAVFYMRIGE